MFYTLHNKPFARVSWSYINMPAGVVIKLTFENCTTGEKYEKKYNTMRGASCAETKFINKLVLGK